MLAANRFLAELAVRLGKDPLPFVERGRQIMAAMQDRPWQPRAGVFAEYRDTRGTGLLHPEPELPTIYHAAEFGAADPFQDPPDVELGGQSPAAPRPLRAGGNNLEL